MAGLADEIVFRGVILQELNKRLNFWKANVITAFLLFNTKRSKAFVMNTGYLLASLF
ncbi:CPBP family intramembrane glutamic endopeptidase [Robertmurraya korlensis]|uniref:CPBP family intramembrane glutamic endopeptidase n=1 Tax=Robertmurraya korlensis TaxID=519977 RepID=UPI000A07181E|nr:CPBP family intramembrane glutamic endopeptidase [Robertmurraya korlensis]